MREYKPTILLRLVAFLLTVPVILVTLALSFDGRGGPSTVLVGVTAGGVVLAAWLWWVLGRPRLIVDGDGVKRVGAFGGETALRFDDVRAYHYRGVQMNAGAHFGLVGAVVAGVAGKRSTAPDQISLVLVGGDGRKLRVTSNWRDADDAVRRLVEAVESRGAAELKQRLLSGARVELGPVTLEKDAIACKGKSVPLAEIKEAYLGGGRFGVKRTGKLLPAFSVDSAKVPCVFLLLDALRARGVNAPDLRPGSAVVDTAGYQIPRR